MWIYFNIWRMSAFVANLSASSISRMPIWNRKRTSLMILLAVKNMFRCFWRGRILCVLCMWDIEITVLIESLMMRTLLWYLESEIKIFCSVYTRESGDFVEKVVFCVFSDEIGLICHLWSICLEFIIISEFVIYYFDDHINDLTVGFSFYWIG
jgi:hypothetical protein